MNIKVKKLMFLIPVIVGILIFVLLVKFKSIPSGGKSLEQAAYVRVFRVPQLAVIPKVTGFGTVQPCKVWKAYPEVSGKIIWLSDRLDVGEFFKKGQKLLQIDSSVYKLKIIQQKAEIKKIEANILELTAKKKNYKATLELQRRSLILSLKEQKRQRELARKKVVSESALEKQQITTLTQQNSLQNIQTNIDLIPSQMKYLQAQLESAKALLGQAQLDLEHTVIRAPFDCRIAKVNVEISQYVQTGQEMLEADATSASEVVAQLDTGRLSILVLSENIKPGQINAATGKYIAIPERLGLTAVIKYSPNGKIFNWKAKCERLEPIDPNTRTVGVAVVVYNPYEKRNANRPPVVKGMYCEVDIYGKKQPDCIVIPRTAIHDDTVYTVNADNRLEIKKIKIKYKMSEFAVIKKGIKKGDVIVSSDLIPAINGMLLDTTVDTALEKKINAIATRKED
jgi:RND family efflux transporter MFP subunit